MRCHSHQIVARQIAQDVAGRHFDIDLGAKLLGYFCSFMPAHGVRMLFARSSRTPLAVRTARAWMFEM
jgi:hypothetical protein